jgi:hypothetical protein
MPIAKNPKVANKRRHESQCAVCRHPRRTEIDRKYLEWNPATKLAVEYGVSRDSLYRHIHQFRLAERRAQNVAQVLDRIVEQGVSSLDGALVDVYAIIRAIELRSKINSQGKYVDRSENMTVDLNALFNRFSAAELQDYIVNSRLPKWFTDIVGSSAVEEQEEEVNEPEGPATVQ